jgi:hypothetical protein
VVAFDTQQVQQLLIPPIKERPAYLGLYALALLLELCPRHLILMRFAQPAIVESDGVAPFARGYFLAWDREASPDLRFVFPPGLAAGTAYRGYGCGNQTGGANPDCAAGGARSAGSGDCALASELASAAMLPASRKDAIRIRIIE